MTRDPIQPHQLVNIYRESAHSQRNAVLLSGLSVVGLVVGACCFISNSPLRLPATLVLWGGSAACALQSRAASDQAERYRKRREVLEQASEEVVLKQIHSGVQLALPSLSFKPEEVERPLVLPAGTSPLEAFAGALQQLLARDLELRTDYVDSIAGPQLIQVQLRPHDLKRMKSLQGEAFSESLQGLLQLPTAPLVSNQKGSLAISIARPDRQFCHFESFIQPTPGDSIRMAIGVNIRRELVEVELSGESLQHFVVGGAPRQGKSQALLAMLGSLVYRYTPQQVQFICGDGKGGVTLGFLNGSPYLLQSVATTRGEAKALAEYLKELVEERYSQFRQVNVQTIDAYNAAATEPLPFVGVFWDEFQDLFDLSLGVRSETLLLFESLSSLAPAAGVFFVWSSQRIDGKLLPPQINSKCLSRLCLKVQKDKDSEFVLNGDTAGVNLLGKGDLLFDDGKEVQRLQGLYVSHRDAVFRGGAGEVLGQVSSSASTSVAPTDSHTLAPKLEEAFRQSAPAAREQAADPFSAEIEGWVRGAVIGARRAGLNQDPIILQVWGCSKGSNARYLAARDKYRRILSDAGMG